MVDIRENFPFLRKKSFLDITLKSKNIKIEKEDIVLISVIRNESLRLPYFIEYYRKQGVDKFIFLDHESTDNSLDILKAENISVFSVRGEFDLKPVWIDYILYLYCIGNWCIVVDADELLVYPNFNSIRELCIFLERDSDSLNCSLIDMYPDGPLIYKRYKAGESFLGYAPYFDPDLKTRHRVFGVGNICLTKVPLFKFSKTMYLSAGQHYLRGSKESKLTGALLHFKFMHDFIEKNNEIYENIKSLTYSDREKGFVQQVKSYSDIIENYPHKNFLNMFSSGSVKYEGVETLRKYGLISNI